jgi:hypothetical protein
LPRGGKRGKREKRSKPLFAVLRCAKLQADVWSFFYLPEVVGRRQVIRLQVELSDAEAEALNRWATSKLRDPRDQIRFAVRQELLRRGLLTACQAGLQGQDQEEGETRDD